MTTLSIVISFGLFILLGWIFFVKIADLRGWINHIEQELRTGKRVPVFPTVDTPPPPPIKNKLEILELEAECRLLKKRYDAVAKLLCAEVDYKKAANARVTELEAALARAEGLNKAHNEQIIQLIEEYQRSHTVTYNMATLIHKIHKIVIPCKNSTSK